MDDVDERQGHLLRALSMAISLLESDSFDERWAEDLRQLKSRVEAGDVWALRDLRGKFGGNGSLNDLVLRNGPAGTLSDDERKKVNRTFSNTLEKIWDDIESLSRLLDMPN